VLWAWGLVTWAVAGLRWITKCLCISFCFFLSLFSFSLLERRVGCE
jgi:hypothetical protein